MPCCGKNRSRELSRYASVTHARSPEPLPSGVTLRYTGTSAILLRGPATGRVYTFTRDVAEQIVARADAEVLLRTGIFTAVS